MSVKASRVALRIGIEIRSVRINALLEHPVELRVKFLLKNKGLNIANRRANQ